MTGYEEERDAEIERVVAQQDISEVVAVAVDSMIEGAIDALLVNLGHQVTCDPKLSCDYGRRLLCRAIDELKKGPPQIIIEDSA